VVSASPGVLFIAMHMPRVYSEKGKETFVTALNGSAQRGNRPKANPNSTSFCDLWRAPYRNNSREQPGTDKERTRDAMVQMKPCPFLRTPRLGFRPYSRKSKHSQS